MVTDVRAYGTQITPLLRSLVTQRKDTLGCYGLNLRRIFLNLLQYKKKGTVQFHTADLILNTYTYKIYILFLLMVMLCATIVVMCEYCGNRIG